MKIRILSIVCVSIAAAWIAGCTAAYKNSDACEQMMRSKLAETSPATSSDKLKIAHTGAGIDGSRVVVEGSLEHVMAASEVAVADAASAARAASAASAAGASGAARVSAASSVKGAAAASAAREASAAVASSSASGVQAVSTKSSKPRTITQPTASECTFSGGTLSAFHWLAPAVLANPPESAASEAAE